jgi:mannose-6-phosphate isomerase-like protein (cupin superfamily)
MPIINNDELETLELPGLRHQTIGGHKQGVKTMEVWLQTMAPGAATPVHCHACEEVILILSGSGTCTVGDEALAFGPNSTLVLGAALPVPWEAPSPNKPLNPRR